MKKWIEKFYPDERCESAYAVDYAGLFRDGYRGLIFDIDNTLVRHGAPADDRVKNLFRQLAEDGFSVCLLSNNRRARVEPFAREVGTAFISMANKPAVKPYLRACRKMGITKEQAVFIGDQLFTDVWGAKRAGIRNILVDPINPREEIQIVLKRRLEKFVLRRYEKDRAQ